jgi:hypothetical protein
LHELYRTALNLPASEMFPIGDPGGERSAGWQQFARTTLGFVPGGAVGPGSLFKQNLWQDFLARRYQRIAALNAAYRSDWPSFATVPMPDTLPADFAPLQDWYQFEGVVIAMHRTAHRFTVLVPMPKRDVTSAVEHARRRELAKRIADLEKPAHTIFDVKFYWAMFLVGQARLGEDTLLDTGSRAPQLMSPMVLGQGYLSETFIAPSHPQDVADRQIVGRDRLKRQTRTLVGEQRHG